MGNAAWRAAIEIADDIEAELTKRLGPAHLTPGAGLPTRSSTST